jgi:hypothetical protein
MNFLVIFIIIFIACHSSKWRPAKWHFEVIHKQEKCTEQYDTKYNDKYQNDTQYNDNYQNDTHQNDFNKNDRQQNSSKQNDTWKKTISILFIILVTVIL